MRNIWKWALLGFSLAIFFLSAPLAAYYVRGTHNDWQTDKMLCRSSYGFGNECSAIINSHEPKLEFKIDRYGDWTENLGIVDSAFELKALSSDDGVIATRLYPDAGNIAIEGNRAYRVTFRSWDLVLRIEELPSRIVMLTDNEKIKLKYYTYVKGVHGGTSIVVQVLMQKSLDPTNVGIAYSSTESDSSRSIRATTSAIIEEDSGDGNILWSFTFHPRAEGKIKFILFCETYSNTFELKERFYDDNDGEAYFIP